MSLAVYRAQLLGRLRVVSDDVAWATAGLTHTQVLYKPDEDEWSIHEHTAHLRDMERQVYLPLLRWATIPDMLDPLDYSRRLWHDLRYTEDEPIAEMLEELKQMREEEIAIFGQLSDADWSQFRTDTRWGPLTCQWIAEVMYRHALDHLQTIMGLRQDLNLAAAQANNRMLVGGYNGGRIG